MIYKLMKRLIEAAIKDGTIEEKREGYAEKLNVFYLHDQITTDQYKELITLLGYEMDIQDADAEADKTAETVETAETAEEGE